MSTTKKGEIKMSTTNDLRKKMVDFLTMNEYMLNVVIEKEREPGRRVLGVIGIVDGEMQWRERVFDASNELIAYDKDYTPITNADIEQFAKKINRYIVKYTI